MMGQILIERVAQGTFAEENQLIETLILDGTHPAFGEGVEVGRLGRELERHACGLQEGIKALGGGIPIVEQEARVGRGPVRNGQIAGDLFSRTRSGRGGCNLPGPGGPAYRRPSLPGARATGPPPRRAGRRPRRAAGRRPRRPTARVRKIFNAPDGDDWERSRSPRSSGPSPERDAGRAVLGIKLRYLRAGRKDDQTRG